MSDTLKPMTGKICMVTGATSGIGAATALASARQGATTIVVGRNQKRCRQTVNRGLGSSLRLTLSPQIP